jgi:hypothetical protein
MAEPEDKNAALIADTLIPLIEKNKLRIPRGGYLVRRGRGRVIVDLVNRPLRPARWAASEYSIRLQSGQSAGRNQWST